MRRSVVAVMLAGVLCASKIGAHHEPGVTIEMLNEQIAKTPNLPELYYQRADELLALAKIEAAETDLKKALELRKDYLPAKRLQARIWQLRGNNNQALAVLQQALAEAPAEHAFLLPGCRQMEGELLLQLNRPADALASLDAALAGSTTPDLETIRLRSEALRLLGKNDERIASLKAAWEKSSAVILRNDWLEALIEAGRGAEALPYIETELGVARFRSSWLIRRARVRLQAAKTAEAQADLRAALEELEKRLVFDPPPVLLLIEHAIVQHFLGNEAAAQADLAKAKELGVTTGELQRVQRLIAAKVGK